ncbi:uncharacterized protein LOC116017451 [Ipomoea triloba]|uniref:uncharacterized protein LOC116017451 n=1 Tax=Ipomoea triloba TaxID=35885 RepID=UPI00125CDDC5|nr:uncharacterized protein LOC116017451 [Ipomoea triloba]
MRLVDASSLIDPSAENLASPGLAEQAQRPPYAASPTRSLFNHGGLTCNPVTESEMSEEGETTSVVHHLQRDSDNHSESDLLLDMAGGMILSPPRPGMNFSDEEALLLTPDFHIDMGGGMMMSMSPPRKNYFSQPIGNFDPFTLSNFGDDSEVQELENRKGMMMRPNCIEEVDAVLGQKNQSLGIWEAENMGGTVQTSDVNNVDERFQLAGGMMNYSLPSDDSLPLGGSFEPYILWDDGAYRVGHELHNRERIMRMTVSRNAVDSELFSHKEFWLNIALQAMNKGLPVAHTDVNLFCKFKYTSFSLIEVEVGIRGAWIEQKSVTTHPPRSGECGVYSRALFEFLEKEFRDTSNSVQPNFKLASLENLDRLFAELEKFVNLERLVAELEKIVNLAGEFKKSHTVRILPALLEAACTMMQLDSPCEPHFPKSSAATNEETKNSSSHKTHTINMWKKHLGIIRQILQQQFVRQLICKSSDAAAKTLTVSTSTFKRAHRDFGITRRCLEDVGTASEENHTAHIWPAAGRGGMLLQQEDSSSEPHIPESSPTNEERNNVVVVELNNSIDAKGGNGSSEKTNTISRWEKDHGITRQVLQQLFGKSRDDAAKTLKVSTSTFKRACRNFGINRWPNHKGKMPNCSLNQKQDVQVVKRHKGIQPCPALPPEEATTTTLQGNSAMSVKATYEDNTIRFPLPSSSTLKYLEEQLETRFKISLENFSIIYQDEEDDWISLTCDSDLMYGMNVLRSSGKTVIKMKIKPKFG